MDEPRRSKLSRYRSDLRNVVGSSASAYGYTLTVWSTGMILSYTYGPPSPPLVFSCFFRAVMGFAVGGVMAFGGVTVEFGGESRSAMGQLPLHFGRLGGGGRVVIVGARAELARVALGAFVATTTFLVVGAENTAADVSAG